MCVGFFSLVKKALFVSNQHQICPALFYVIKKIYVHITICHLTTRKFPPTLKNIYIAALNDSATIIGPIYLDVYLCTASCQQSYKCMNHKGPAAAVMNCEVNAE